MEHERIAQEGRPFLLKGGFLPKTNRAYKSAKRNRELDRLKKREEKRRKRLGIENPAEDGVAQPVPSVETPGTETPDATPSEGET
jgi:hypothetical protein